MLTSPVPLSSNPAVYGTDLLAKTVVPITKGEIQTQCLAKGRR